MENPLCGHRTKKFQFFWSLISIYNIYFRVLTFGIITDVKLLLSPLMTAAMKTTKPQFKINFAHSAYVTFMKPFIGLREKLHFLQWTYIQTHPSNIFIHIQYLETSHISAKMVKVFWAAKWCVGQSHAS